LIKVTYTVLKNNP